MRRKKKPKQSTARQPKGEIGVCRRCGCTDDDCRGCIARTGAPCHWVKPDLCSACVPAGKSRGAL